MRPMTPSSSAQKETPPVGGVGPAILSPGGLTGAIMVVSNMSVKQSCRPTLVLVEPKLDILKHEAQRSSRK